MLRINSHHLLTIFDNRSPIEGNTVVIEGKSFHSIDLAPRHLYLGQGGRELLSPLSRFNSVRFASSFGNELVHS
jgi:hypothetical protein